MFDGVCGIEKKQKVLERTVFGWRKRALFVSVCEFVWPQVCSRGLFCILRWFSEENPIYVSLKFGKAQKFEGDLFNKRVFKLSELKTIRKEIFSVRRRFNVPPEERARIQLDEYEEEPAESVWLSCCTWNPACWKKTCCYERKKPE